MPDDKRPVVYDENLSFFRNLVLQLRLVWLLFRDQRVPLWLKTLPIGSLVYLISPLDILPDTVPILTQIDDLAVVLLGLRLFIDLSPREVVDEHMRSLLGPDADWKVEDREDKSSPSDNPALETSKRQVIEGTFSDSQPPDEPEA